MGEASTVTPAPARGRPPRYVTYRCEGCEVGIEFDANQLEEGQTKIVPCPNCGMETPIVSPPGMQEAARSIAAKARRRASAAFRVLRDCSNAASEAVRSSPPATGRGTPSPGTSTAPASITSPRVQTPVYQALPVKGYVYVLSNPSMPGLVKIGSSERPVQQRVYELSGSTGVPQPFSIERAFAVCVLPREAEVHVHRSLATFRINRQREFFRMAVEEAVQSIHSLLLNQSMLASAPPNISRGKLQVAKIAWRAATGFLRFVVGVFAVFLKVVFLLIRWALIFFFSLAAAVMREPRRRKHWM